MSMIVSPAEIHHARLSPDELTSMPADQEPTYLAPGTEPSVAPKHV